MTARPALLSPQEEGRQVRTYRPVWRTASIEIVLLLIVVGVVLMVSRFVHPTLTETQKTAVGISFALLPLLLWYGISYRQEAQARRPRGRLLIVLVLSMLAANAVGVPLVERVFAVDQWLPTTGGLTRIIGYMLAYGVTSEFLKFAVLRFSVWPIYFKTRADGIAYSMAAGLGYAAVLSINYVVNEAPEPSAVALRVAGITLSQVAIGTIVGFQLAELTIGKPPVLWMPLSVALAALLQGLYVAFRAGLIVGGISATATGNVPAASLGIAMFMVVLLFSTISFLINNAERRARRSPEFSS